MALKLTRYAKENARDENSRKKVKDFSISKMSSWKLILEREGKYYPSNAYMMFKDDNPFQFINIQCARFKGTDRVLFIDKKEYTSPIHE